MTRLRAEAPLGGLSEAHGAIRMAATVPGRITWLAPWPGEEVALGHALMLAHSLSFPAPGEVLSSSVGRILWAGRAQALLIGPDPSPECAAHGAVVDQSDGWAALLLTGTGAADVLARLCPLDLRPSCFSPGRTARCLLGHMSAQITAVESGYELLVLRSMAESAAREIAEASRSVAARAGEGARRR